MPEGGEIRDFSEANMIEDQERCLKCGTQEGLQGVAVTIGRKTFHLFYLCGKCGKVNIEELVQIIGSYREEKTDSSDDR
jgi:ribosomal protein S27AE